MYLEWCFEGLSAYFTKSLTTSVAWPTRHGPAAGTFMILVAYRHGLRASESRSRSAAPSCTSAGARLARAIWYSPRARACARYGVLVVGEEMKGLVNCNFLPGSARRLELVACRARVLLAKVPIAFLSNH
jgi:hypothetical protein